MNTKGKRLSEAPVDKELEKIIAKAIVGNNTFAFSDGSEYIGEWLEVDGVKLRCGTGIFKYGPEEYNGNWQNDHMCGKGVYKFASGAVYEGNFIGNLFDGYGEYRFPDGAVYRYITQLITIH